MPKRACWPSTSSTEGWNPEPIPALRGDACYHDLCAVDGRVAERTLTEDGISEFRAVPITRLERRPAAQAVRWYHVLAIKCVRGTTHLHRVRLDQNEDDTKHKFNTSEHLRQIPPGTGTFDRIYGHRPDAESLNAALDTTWRHKRIIAYGADSPKHRTRSHVAGTSSARSSSRQTWQGRHSPSPAVDADCTPHGVRPEERRG